MHYFDHDHKDALSAYWPRTATLDWCEENYVECKYIAEFWNSLTNLSYVLLALYGMFNAWRYGMERRFLLAYASIGVVGIGSFLFHATLSYEMQLMDELPMIYCVCVLTYSIFQADAKSRRRDLLLRALLIIDAGLITLSYLYNKNPLFHQWAFGLHCAAIFLRGSRHYHSLARSPAKQNLRNLLLIGWGLHVLGFVCWNVDNVFCPYLRAGRLWLGPWAQWVLQLHGWWHVFTGMGAYVYIVANQWLSLMCGDQHSEWQVRWRLGWLPTIEPVEEPQLLATRHKQE